MIFDKHINEINRKVMGTLTYINRIEVYFDKDTRKIIIQYLVLTILHYCVTLWGNTNTNLFKTAQKLQNFAAKFIDLNANVLFY